jgi:hypothetical protein
MDLPELPVFSMEDTVDLVNAGSGVLFVGPELLRYREADVEESVTQYVRRKLYEQYQADIDFFHPEEGLFLFKSPTKRTWIKVKMTQMYEKIWEDQVFWDLNESTLRCLSQLPFHLIVSVTSDNFIYKSMKKYGLLPESSFFLGDISDRLFYFFFQKTCISNTFPLSVFITCDF